MRITTAVNRNLCDNADHSRHLSCYGPSPKRAGEYASASCPERGERVDSRYVRRGAGFTLVGVVLSLALAAAVTVMIASLMARAEQVARVSRQKFIAMNVAREGLELVRAVRDNNWMKDYASNDQWLEGGLCEGSYGGGSHQFIIDPATVRNNSEVKDTGDPSADSSLYVQPSGEWTHEAVLGQDPMYRRVMEIDCDTKDDDPPYVTVTSAVTWEDRGKGIEIQIKEQLYNWR